MEERKKERKSKKAKEAIVEQLSDYSKDDCVEFYKSIMKLLEKRKVARSDFKKLVVKTCNDFKLTEAKTEDIEPKDDVGNIIIGCFSVIVDEYDFYNKNFEDEVYNKTGTVLNIIDTYLKKCKKMTKEEYREFHDIREFEDFEDSC